MIHPAIKSKFHSLLFDTALFLLLTYLLQGILYLCGFRLREYLKIIRLVILCVGLVGGILQKLIDIPKKSSRMILLCIFCDFSSSVCSDWQRTCMVFLPAGAYR